MDDYIKGKRILFITTKNIDYIRNQQEIKILRAMAGNVQIVYSKCKSYPLRLFVIYIRLLFMSLKAVDTIFIGFSPQLILPVFFWKMSNKTIIIDFFISVFDTLVNDRKTFKDNSIMARFCHWLDDRTLSKSKLVIADTEAHGKYFIDEFGLARSIIKVLYLEADTGLYYPRKIKKPQELEGKFVVMYFGSVLPLQGLEVVLQSADILKEISNIQFIIVGPLKKCSYKPVSNNMLCIPWLSQDKLAETIAMADLCLAGHFNGSIQKAKRTIPGKAYIYEAMHKPMILGDNKANHERYSEKQEGIYFVEMGSAEKLADLIKKIFETYTHKKVGDLNGRK
ncbi:glycosyltransferase [Lachnotalea sp. AF33-28]|uniref:glycosyltransferase n=1 Tax=Lachnotalea sp. AF33-28 TaxID=2292046 RepID=UPI000E47D80C|nr:glycosyltransferase [Lachnotalea sp. AF33-28]RHP34980.1 glycosyltransferase [Lachnotalea sp. AF33-28]